MQIYDVIDIYRCRYYLLDIEIGLPEPVDDIEDDEEEGHCNEEKSARNLQ